MTRELTIPAEIFAQMVALAQAQAPIEACGILAGKDITAQKLYAMTNVDNSSDHFAMEPAEQFAVMKAMRAEELEMLAVYHSHPITPARPSKEDIRLAFTPGVIYVILSLADEGNPVVKGFDIQDGDVSEVGVTVLSDK